MLLVLFKVNCCSKIAVLQFFHWGRIDIPVVELTNNIDLLRTVYLFLGKFEGNFEDRFTFRLFFLIIMPSIHGKVNNYPRELVNRPDRNI
jgi:hypothetical protein